MNTLKTTFLMALLTALLVTAGGASGGLQGMVMALIFAAVMNGIGYWFQRQDRFTHVRGERKSTPGGPTLYAVVQEFAQRADMPMPKLYIIPTATANAFATGRNERHGAVG